VWNSLRHIGRKFRTRRGKIKKILPLSSAIRNWGTGPPAPARRSWGNPSVDAFFPEESRCINGINKRLSSATTLAISHPLDQGDPTFPRMAVADPGALQ
jgi:hypothetical protein